jgi:hypothetical protein
MNAQIVVALFFKLVPAVVGWAYFAKHVKGALQVGVVQSVEQIIQRQELIMH